MNSLINAFSTAWSRSFDYSGRSNRGDYWWFVLADFIVLLVLFLVGNIVDIIGKIAILYVIAQILPVLPLTIRRLRDSGKSWPWIFIQFVPMIGGIWMIVLLSQPSILG